MSPQKFLRLKIERYKTKSLQNLNIKMKGFIPFAKLTNLKTPYLFETVVLYADDSGEG